jgi:hypothetical protein
VLWLKRDLIFGKVITVYRLEQLSDQRNNSEFVELGAETYLVEVLIFVMQSNADVYPHLHKLAARCRAHEQLLSSQNWCRTADSVFIKLL